MKYFKVPNSGKLTLRSQRDVSDQMKHQELQANFISVRTVFLIEIAGKMKAE